MRSTTANDDVPGHAAPRRAGSHARPLAGFLLLSGALHAAALVTLPALLPDKRDAAPPRVLEIALVQAEPLPQTVESAVSPPAPQPRRAPQRVAKAPVQPAPRGEPDTPAPVLALPEPRPAAEPSFAVPAPKPAETRTDVASVALTPPAFGAAYLRNPAPPYPMAAKRGNVQGTVTLRVLVTRDGLPARVELERTSGSNHLDQAALDTVRTWRFTPARRGAEPVEDTVIVPIVFRLERAS